MFERFTDRARKVLQLANQEAARCGHPAVGTGHVFLGLLKEGGGVGASVLKNLGVDVRALRVTVEGMVPVVPGASVPADLVRLPRTDGTDAALRRAVVEATALGHNYVGTEHVLLGLIGWSDECVAASTLAAAGVTAEAIRKEVVDLVGPQSRKITATLKTDEAQLRDWFAGMAMQYVMGHPAAVIADGDPAADVALVAYAQADAMMAARAGKPEAPRG